jgi:protein-S-isoprenylcysteine O-methyltransferase Ste14
MKKESEHEISIILFWTMCFLSIYGLTKSFAHYSDPGWLRALICGIVLLFYLVISTMDFDNEDYRRAKAQKALKPYFFKTARLSVMILFSLCAFFPYNGRWEWPLPWPVNLIYVIALLFLLICIFKVFEIRHTLWKGKDDDDLD